MHQQVLQHIDEGYAFITYKVNYEQMEEEMSKEVLKVEENKRVFENMRKNITSMNQ